MNAKFTINKILIDSTSKDIEVGVVREFCDGFNLILGENEKGKSSLMNFIKEGLFRIKGSDNGIINFRIEDEKNCCNYRANIKQNKALINQRCTLINEDNIEVDYSIIEKTIDQNYFFEGFVINLDDLMKAQTKDNDSFINAIKDPSADKLNVFLKEINLEILKVLSPEKKPKKETKELIAKIKNLDLELLELSKKENEYIEQINTIKLSDLSLKELSIKHQAILTRKKLLELNLDLNNLKFKKNNIFSEFNSNFFENKNQYLNILQSKGVFESNLLNIEKNDSRIKVLSEEFLNHKIMLNNQHGINYSEDAVLNFSFDYNKNKIIKEIIEKNNDLTQKLKTNEFRISNLKEELIKLDLEKNNLASPIEIDIKELTRLNTELEDRLSYYQLLTIEIEKLSLSNPTTQNNSIVGNIFVCLSIIGFLVFIVSIYIKSLPTIVFSLIIIIVSIFGFLTYKKSINKENNNNSRELINKRSERKNILDNLKTRFLSYYPQINNINDLELSLKFESIKRELQDKIKDYQNYKKNLEQITSQTKEKEALIDLIEKDNLEIKKEIDELNSKSLSIIDKNLCFESTNPKDYLEIFDFIKSLKTNLEQKTSLEKENLELKRQNNEILKDFSDFINRCNIKIVLSDNFSSMLDELKEYDIKNDSLKSSLDTIDKEIEIITREIDKYSSNEDLLKFKNEIDDSNIDSQLNEILYKIEQKQKEKQEAMAQAASLEKFEGVSEIRIQKEKEISKYQKMIKKLLINETILSLCQKAKENFDKTQPDLLNAQKYLSFLTNGKYDRINLELKEISNSSGSNIKKWENLSRGTKEQLYFALRLGYASNYSKDKITLKPNGRANLPLIVDDAFVNFDSSRTKNALLCLLEFSKTNQVFFFTCHNELILKHIDDIEFKDYSINKIYL